MNSIRKYLKPVTHFLILTILLQSCAIYRKDPVSLDQAALANTKTMVVFKDGKVEKFRYVTSDDRQYSGVRQVSRDMVQIPINPEEVSYVRVKNKKASTIVSIAGAAAFTGLIIAALNFSLDIDLEGSY